MPQRTLRFRIRQDGQVEETVEGLVGDSCYQLTERLEGALGKVQSRQPTSEIYLQSASQSQTQPVPATLH